MLLKRWGWIWVGLACALSACGGDAEPSGRVRKEVSQLNDDEKARFVAALLKMKQTPSRRTDVLLEDGSVPSAYDYYVKIHLDAFGGSSQPTHFIHPHGTPHFLPWHRQMLQQFESDLREISGDATVTIPYWDWTNPASTNTVFSDALLGGDGDPNNEYIVGTGAFAMGQWQIVVHDPSADENDHPDDPTADTRPCVGVVSSRGLVRCFKREGSALPTSANVSDSLKIPTYDVDPFNDASDGAKSFRNHMEGWKPYGMHNLVHVFISGHMGTGASPNDPAFYLHHANIDRLWSQWQSRYGNDTFPASYADAELYVFGTTARSTFNLETTGVNYQ